VQSIFFRRAVCRLLTAVKYFSIGKGYGRDGSIILPRGIVQMPKPFLPLLALAIGLSTTTTATAFECKVCHSKNPKMVAMHKALQGEGCFGCHNAGEKLMGKSQPKDRESMLKRRVTDVQCVRCHGKKEPS